MKINWQELKMILSAKKLKALCLGEFPIVDKEFIGTMKKYGKSLESFHAQKGIEFEENDVESSPEELREEFKNQFPVFSLLKNSEKWIMKKNKKPKICCDN
jgi:hypothetical protein